MGRNEQEVTDSSSGHRASKREQAQIKTCEILRKRFITMLAGKRGYGVCSLGDNIKKLPGHSPEKSTPADPVLVKGDNVVGMN